ncbi:hypothetical protein BUALT_Bualt11G0068700 [Buddleja alternifolia]|uniref:Transcriptional adapter 1 n=1 Tax=Buddleja alternifolia TaxID=168488 RepID=A0AAV6WS40_9LAMI|nr:hypothetical protein BUALT_Bualt11G0068700 [Buddleja alternifolia]
MITMNLGAKTPGVRHCPRIDTIELKLHMERKLGRQKADQYFNLLNRYFSLKLSKSEFDKLCLGLLGRENIFLHNGLIRAIIKNACVAKSPPPQKPKTSLNVKVPNESQRNSLQSSRKGRTPTPWAKDRPSPLGPHGKPQNVLCEDSMLKVQEQQSATELLSLHSRPPVEVTSVEEGEEVEQSPGIHSRSPLRAPLGVSLNAKGTRKELCYGSPPSINMDTCYTNGEFPSTSSLRTKLEQKLRVEGLNVSTDCVKLLNNGLDVFLKRLLKPCLDLSASRCLKKSNRSFTVSMTDFQVAMELDPRILGYDWAVQLEKMSLRASEGYMDG